MPGHTYSCALINKRIALVAGAPLDNSYKRAYQLNRSWGNTEGGRSKAEASSGFFISCGNKRLPYLVFTSIVKKGRKMRTMTWRLGVFSAIGAVGVLSLTLSSAMTASAAPLNTITIKDGSGTTTNPAGLDPNTSFCAYPSNGKGAGYTSVTVDSDYPSPACATGFPANPFVINATQAASNSWGSALAGTNWVGPNAMGTSDAPDAGGFIYHHVGPPACPAGNAPSGFATCNFYIYDATFKLPCSKGLTAVMKGNMKADNLAGVFLNGHFIKRQAVGTGFSYDGVNPPAANFGSGTPFGAGVPAADYVLGVNTVDFVVWDSTQPATGLDYQFIVKATCPK